MAQHELPPPPCTHFGYVKRQWSPFFALDILYISSRELLEAMLRTRAEDQQWQTAEGWLSGGSAGKAD